MQIIKRDGNKVDFEKIKIERAISKAFFSVDSSITEKDLRKMSEKNRRDN